LFGRLRIAWLRRTRNIGIPRVSGFHRFFTQGLLRRRERDGDEMLARGTLNLPSAQTFIALQVLVALGTGELELAHGMTVSGACARANVELRVGFVWQLSSRPDETLILKHGVKSEGRIPKSEKSPKAEFRNLRA
jgi:hypothetical protein